MSKEKNSITLEQALSQPRMSSYTTASYHQEKRDFSPLELYIWNSLLSGLFHFSLELCEVLIRNAVADALEKEYGEKWPWSESFERSLPSPKSGYNSRQSLQQVRKKNTSVGQIIAKLPLAFWEHMFTVRHEQRLWDKHLRDVLPNTDKSISIRDLIISIHDDINKIRYFRNRICHYEPIFNRDYTQYLSCATRLISYRSLEAASIVTKVNNINFNSYLLKISLWLGLSTKLKNTFPYELFKRLSMKIFFYLISKIGTL